MRRQAPRYCRCGTRLARDNRGQLCGSCEQRTRTVMAQAPTVPAEVWHTDRLRDALAAWHMGKVIQAYRNHPWHGRPLAQGVVAGWAGMTQTQLSRLENGPPPQDLAKLRQWARILGIPADLLWFQVPEQSAAGVHAPHANATADRPLTTLSSRDPTSEAGDDEYDAWELARRVAASDVGEETVGRLEAAVDDLATAYPKVPPAELLCEVRRHLGYVGRLVDARMSLDERRRLLVVGGWLSLLGATVHTDLKQQRAATARLQAAASLARQAGHDEIRAWCFETEAWRVLTEGEYGRALELSQAAQTLAPHGSSASIQATAQEGRARARLGQQADTYAAIDRVHKLVAPLAKPNRPEHHYRYDPDKSVAYTATTLAWLGDPAAETYAREVIAGSV